MRPCPRLFSGVGEFSWSPNGLDYARLLCNTKRKAKPIGEIMKVIVAEAMGMCFGVRDALRRVGEVDRPAETTIDGQLVHNELLLQQLDQQGFRQTHEHTALFA